MVTTTDFEKFRSELTLFHEGFSKPLAKHEIVDSELYAANQGKQTQFTEKALLTAGTCVYSHGQESVEIIHKGDTRPLLFARDDAVKMSKIRSAGGRKKLEREAEAKKRTGDSFFEAGKFEAALVTYSEALRNLDSASVELALKLRLAASDAALKGGNAERAEAEADFAQSLAPDADSPRFRRAIARLAQGKWQLAEDDLVRVYFCASQILRIMSRAAGRVQADADCLCRQKEITHQGSYSRRDSQL